jgi:hypothetical protein
MLKFSIVYLLMKQHILKTNIVKELRVSEYVNMHLGALLGRKMDDYKYMICKVSK